MIYGIIKKDFREEMSPLRIALCGLDMVSQFDFFPFIIMRSFITFYFFFVGCKWISLTFRPSREAPVG